jgi:hypothetical protein
MLSLRLHQYYFHKVPATETKESISHLTLNFQIVAYSHTSHEDYFIPTVHLKFNLRQFNCPSQMATCFCISMSPSVPSHTQTHTHTHTVLVCYNVITTRITPLFKLITKCIKY